MSDGTLLRTPLNNWHHTHSGRMVEFAGWQMPIQYSTIVDEHNAVRKQAGLFDICHMGRLRFEGPGAEQFLNHILSNDVSPLKVGEIRYSLVCNQAGGVLDDVLVYRFEDHWMLVVNGANRMKIVHWIEQHRSGFSFESADQTLTTGMLALQGPQALTIGSKLADADLSALNYYTGMYDTFATLPALITRTGYTGEDGIEIIAPTGDMAAIWSAIMTAGESHGIFAAGLGCRDTLRLEAAMPLYGHELTEAIDPLTAGLKFAVKLKKDDFVGKDALLAIQQAGTTRKRVGLILEGRRIAREGSAVCADDQAIGEVTSGTFSPTLQQTIAMAFVDNAHAAIGTPVEVDIRGKRVRATVSRLPFYKRP